VEGLHTTKNTTSGVKVIKNYSQLTIVRKLAGAFVPASFSG